MAYGKEHFLARWSRLKRAVAPLPPALPPVPSAAVAPPQAALPSLDSLDFSSEFSGFLQPQVEESLKRAALKKLFHSGPFNEMDGLDVYVEDFNTFDPIPEEMLRQLMARSFPGVEQPPVNQAETTAELSLPQAQQATEAAPQPRQEPND